MRDNELRALLPDTPIRGPAIRRQFDADLEQETLIVRELCGNARRLRLDVLQRHTLGALELVRERGEPHLLLDAGDQPLGVELAPPPDQGPVARGEHRVDRIAAATAVVLRILVEHTDVIVDAILADGRPRVIVTGDAVPRPLAELKAANEDKERRATPTRWEPSSR